MTAKYAAFLAAITIDDNNNDFVMEEGGVSYTAIITQGTYVLRGDGAAGDLCSAIKTAMEAATPTNTYNVTVAWSIDNASRGATVTIARATGAATFRPRFDSGSNNFSEEVIGFTNAALVAGTTFSSTVTPTSIWVSSQIITSERARKTTDAIRNTKRNGARTGVLRGGPYVGRTVGISYLDARRAFSLCPTSTITDANACLDTFLDSIADGTSFEFHKQTTTTISSTTLSALSASTYVGDYVTSDAQAKEYDPERPEPGLSLYNVSIDLWQQAGA